MSFKILYVTATTLESETLKDISGMRSLREKYMSGNTETSILITGVGSVATAWSMKDWLSSHERPDLIINGGIAGSFNDEIKTGDVVMPVSDCFADAGIEDGDNYLTLFDYGLAGRDEYPYSSGMIICENAYSERLRNIFRPVKAITVNTATGSDLSRDKLVRRFNPDIETMEGATFFYICSRENIPFLALRAISNKVERRNKDNWDIPLALNNLSEKLKEIIVTLK